MQPKPEPRRCYRFKMRSSVLPPVAESHEPLILTHRSPPWLSLRRMLATDSTVFAVYSVSTLQYSSLYRVSSLYPVSAVIAVLSFAFRAHSQSTNGDNATKRTRRRRLGSLCHYIRYLFLLTSKKSISHRVAAAKNEPERRRNVCFYVFVLCCDIRMILH